MKGIIDLGNNPDDKIFKGAYSKGDKLNCIYAVVNMAIRDWYGDRRGMRKILYTDGNLIKNPLNHEFTREDYNKTDQILEGAILFLDIMSESGEEDISRELVSSVCLELNQLRLFYECMYNNRVLNEKALEKSEFLKLSLPQVIQSWLSYYQSQMILSREREVQRRRDLDFVTGFESLVASERASLFNGIHVSMSDSFEQLLEDMDALFRYVFYIKADERVYSESELRELDFITPYENENFSFLNGVALADTLLCHLEASFRYEGWFVSLRHDSGGETYYFFPNDDKPYKTHIASSLRNKQNIMLSVADENEKAYLTKEALCFSKDQIDREFFEVSKQIDLSDFESFHLDKNVYVQLSTYTNAEISAFLRKSKPYYRRCSFNGMDVEEYLSAYVFLNTISKVYHCASVSTDDLSTYVPFVSLDYLCNEFSRLHGYKIDKAKKLIDCYVFDKNVSEKKKLGDIFTRPLVCVGVNTVLMSEALINQMNVNRNIEVLLEWNNVNLAPMGKELERRMIDMLTNVEGLVVNKNHIEFDAYDGRAVEFDFIATLDDWLVLIEMKSLIQPYDNDELYKRRTTLSEGVKQVKRRVRVLQRDWTKIKNMVSVSLPDKPYDDNHIIKIVCSDVGDYTGLEEDGVILTDCETVVKYFTNPFIHVVSKKSGEVSESRIRTLWKSGRPTAEEFIRYLHNPETMSHIMGCIDIEQKPIPILKGQKRIAFFDLVVTKNPWKKLAEKYGVIG